MITKWLSSSTTTIIDEFDWRGVLQGYVTHDGFTSDKRMGSTTLWQLAPAPMARFSVLLKDNRFYLIDWYDIGIPKHSFETLEAAIVAARFMYND